MTPAATEGPFFVDELLQRSDIRTDPSDGSVKNGAPLRLTINVLRLGGVAMVVAGMLGTRQVIAIPMIAAYALIVIGLLDIFLVPLLLARTWRTPL